MKVLYNWHFRKCFMYLTIFARFPNHHEYQCASMTFSTTRHVFSGRVGRGCVSIGHVYFKKLHSQREQCSMYRVLFLFLFLKAISIEYIFFNLHQMFLATPFRMVSTFNKFLVLGRIIFCLHFNLFLQILQETKWHWDVATTASLLSWVGLCQCLGQHVLKLVSIAWSHCVTSFDPIYCLLVSPNNWGHKSHILLGKHPVAPNARVVFFCGFFP